MIIKNASDLIQIHPLDLQRPLSGRTPPFDNKGITDKPALLHTSLKDHIDILVPVKEQSSRFQIFFPRLLQPRMSRCLRQTSNLPRKVRSFLDILLYLIGVLNITFASL